MFRFLLLLALLVAAVLTVRNMEGLPLPWPSTPPWARETARAPGSDPAGPEAAPSEGKPGAEALKAQAWAAADRRPISIPALRARSYPGSALTKVRTLPRGANYDRFVVSYRSDGLKIYALLTVPTGAAPQGGWPAIAFNHGYIPPDEYRTTQRYVAYQDAFARSGYVTLKSDYRGHGDSEGVAGGGYDDPGYTIDVLNAVASLRRDRRVNPDRIGLWGHSMGGQLSLRAMLVDPDLKAACLWAGVVAGYDTLATDWNRPATQPRPVLDDLNRQFLQRLSPNAFLADLKGRPLQLHHGTADKDVPYGFQVELAGDLRRARQPFTAFRYDGDDHNLSRNLTLALRRSVAFFDEHL